MVRVTGNVVTQGWSGKLGQHIVFRQRGGNTYVVKAPDFSNRVLSDLQQKQVSRFKQAVHYAQYVLKTPVLKQRYKELSSISESVYHKAIKDFLKPRGSRVIADLVEKADNPDRKPVKGHVSRTSESVQKVGFVQCSDCDEWFQQEMSHMVALTEQEVGTFGCFLPP